MNFKHKYFINAKVEEVYEKLFQIEKWPDLIPHVTEIQPLNTDDKEQRVIMTIQNQKGIEQMETVRTFVKDKYITFHQPSPPKPLSIHNGKWNLQEFDGGTIVESVHEIKSYMPFMGKIIPYIAWNLFIKKNSILTLRSIKLDLEFGKSSINRIIKDSCFIKHSIDVNLTIDEAFNTIGNPELWPILFPTAINVKVLKREIALIEFELNEYVGKKVFFSHIHFHLDRVNHCIYYQHYPPSFPVKYMVIRWIFEELENNRCRFTILREYNFNIPIIGKVVAYTMGRRIIKKHVDDYFNDLRIFVKSLSVCKWFEEKNFPISNRRRKIIYKPD